jgi:cell fate regulator YaaT (PSP1 superfamily)
MRTAQEKFVREYLLVLDNDRDAYSELIEVVRKHEGEVFAISSELREAFEEYISQVADREREDGRQVGGDLIAQLLAGFGSEVFEDIARHYVEKAGN